MLRHTCLDLSLGRCLISLPRCITLEDITLILISQQNTGSFMIIYDNASWDIVSTADLWEDTCLNNKNELNQDNFVLVRQEYVVEGIVCFMAAYLL
ncbi:hypothetical protein IHE45_09G048700 [Dioscorea alata]|uniref:Uncharacterized protein n=1 Tax=Dioscorea alata TaxID=55571 RepID=A0ACB7VF18_DIOAL|nr:hypothetical protein IHE45_09G048700 [Dioscorea alata]